MTENTVSSNGSTAPASKAVSKDKLWKQVVALRSAPTAGTQGNAQLLASKAECEHEFAATAVAETVAELTDGVAGQQQDATVDSSGNTVGIGEVFAKTEDGGDYVDDEIGDANQVSESKPGASGEMVPNGSGMGIGPANPVGSGLDQFVHAYQTKRLNRKRSTNRTPIAEE